MPVTSITSIMADPGAYATAYNSRRSEQQAQEVLSAAKKEQSGPQYENPEPVKPGENAVKVSVPERLRSELNPTRANEVLEEVLAKMAGAHPYDLMNVQLDFESGLLPSAYV